MSIMTTVSRIRTCATYKKRWESAVDKVREAMATDDPDTMRYYANVANDYLAKYLELKYGKE